MASEGGSQATGDASKAPGPSGAATDLGTHPERDLHLRSFKLRFASQREQGRSNVSLTKPLGLPDRLTDKLYSAARSGEVSALAAARALQRVRDKYERGPRDKYHAPLTSSQVYGWYPASADMVQARSDPRLSHHIRDSAWLRARLTVLAADDKLKQR